MRRVWEQRARREVGLEVSAVRMGMDGGGSGRVVHWRIWASLVGLRPAIAMELNDDDEEVVLRNLRACLRTCLPVKPDAPRIIRSNVGAVGTAMAFLTHF